MSSVVAAKMPLRRDSFAKANKGDFDLSEDRQSRAVQLLLGHTKVESTVRYPGIEVDDALAMAEQGHVLETDPNFRISAWIARGGQSNSKLLIEGLRKAGLSE